MTIKYDDEAYIDFVEAVLSAGRIYGYKITCDAAELAADTFFAKHGE